MKLRDILEIVDAKEIYIDNPDIYDIDFKSAFGTDLMSDALCHLIDADERELLITGLANMQIFNTANTLDISVVLIVRGKPIDDYMIEGAKTNHVSVFTTQCTMYETCGRLYEKGLGK